MDGSRRTGCLENTKDDMLQLVIKWASDSAPVERVLWLHGLAGSGKSTLSTTLADLFRRSGALGAFLFFDRDVSLNVVLQSWPRRPDARYQLSSFHPNIGDLMVAAIENPPQTLISSIPSQFQLLIDSLSMESLPTKSNIVLILDALDKCVTTKDHTALLKTLAEPSAHLPSNFWLVITSRPDIDIRVAFESQHHVLTLELDLTSATSKDDILAYLQHPMDTIQKKKRYLDNDWPGKKNIYALARRAASLFVWASIACNFIDAHDPRKCLDIVLQGDPTSTPEVAPDALY
jgi:hypothetical protein